MSTSVFMSYSHENAAFVNRLRKDLEAHGIHVWIDHESLSPGTPDWDEAIRVALRSVDAALFVASPDARRSLFVRDELNVARMYERTIYPIWVAGDHWIDCVPIGWGATQYVDARGASYAAALDTLLGALGAAPAPTTPSAASVTATPPTSPAKTIITDPDDLARQIQAAQKSAQAHGAASVSSNELLRLSDLLAANDWDGADAESQQLLRKAAGVADNEAINSQKRAAAIPDTLLKSMDDMWRETSGEGLRSRRWVRFFGQGVTEYRAWWSFETWLEYRLKELGR